MLSPTTRDAVTAGRCFHIMVALADGEAHG
jgi:hypothetical protein